MTDLVLTCFRGFRGFRVLGFRGFRGLQGLGFRSFQALWGVSGSGLIVQGAEKPP